MRPLLVSIPFCCALLCGQSPPGQIIVVDRGIRSGEKASLVPASTLKGIRVVGDHFRIGASGETWVIDTIRTWTVKGIADSFQLVTLLGGIEAAPRPKGQPAEPDCDCHNLAKIRSSSLQGGSAGSSGGELAVSPSVGGTLQVDFRHLEWSVPGGVDIQFGVMGSGKDQRRVWLNHAVETSEVHTLMVFGEHGRLQGRYAVEESKVGISVQVWAHRSAPVEIIRAADLVEVVLRSDGSFDASKADAATLRLGPRGGRAVETHVESEDGRPRLVAKFRRTSTGLQSSDVNACLTGRQLDGTPFEGCDLLRWGR